MLKNIKLLLMVFLASYSLEAPAYGNRKILVKTAKVEISELYDTYLAIGQSKNDQSRSYYAKSTGIVDSISASQGRQVKKGDIIITIDKQIAEANKSQAEAAFKAAEVAYGRDQSLFSKKFISEDAIEKAKVNLENARLALAEATKTYKEMFITAPFDGEIGVIKVRVGDQVKPDDYLFSIIAASDKSIFLELPESLCGKVSSNTEIMLYDTKGNKVPAALTAISNYVSEAGTISIKIMATNDDKLIHGSYINAELYINKHQGLSIPEQAVLKNDKGNFVYQIGENNSVKQIYVELGTRTNNVIEILSSNLKAGDQIILEGLTKVQEGSVVEIIPLGN